LRTQNTVQNVWSYTQHNVKRKLLLITNHANKKNTCTENPALPNAGSCAVFHITLNYGQWRIGGEWKGVLRAHRDATQAGRAWGELKHLAKKVRQRFLLKERNEVSSGNNNNNNTFQFTTAGQGGLKKICLYKYSYCI